MHPLRYVATQIAPAMPVPRSIGMFAGSRVNWASGGSLNCAQSGDSGYPTWANTAPTAATIGIAGAVATNAAPMP
jgi:hypothetical protein